MSKEGKPREQYLNQGDPETLRVFHKEFDDIMIINADSFDSKIHTRVNELGQKVDHRGIVVDKEPVKGADPATK